MAKKTTTKPKAKAKPKQKSRAKASAAERKNKKEITADNPKAAGPPEVEIDLKQLEKLCRVNPTQPEIAAFFGCSLSTIEERMRSDPDFNNIVTQGRGMGKVSLRRKMWSKAIEENDTTMQIWLSKNELAMTDKVDNKNLNANLDLEEEDEEIYNRYFNGGK